MIKYYKQYCENKHIYSLFQKRHSVDLQSIVFSMKGGGSWDMFQTKMTTRMIY